MKLYRRFAWDARPKPCPVCGKNAYSVYSTHPYPHNMGAKHWQVQACDSYCAEISRVRSSS